MNHLPSFFLLFSLTLFSISTAQDRAPHGLAHENPIAFSPSAFDFFHPNTKQSGAGVQTSCAESNCSPLPLAAQVEAMEAHESSKEGSWHLGAGGIAGIVFGLAFAVLSCVGVYYVVVTRRPNLSRANSVGPDA